MILCLFFFFKQKTAYEMRISDWSSDVCSSDLQPKPDEYRDWQPYAQVPAFADGDLRLFESGAILLYLGEQDERLLPRDPAQRWSAISWLIAALNSVEPMLMQIVNLDVFQAHQPRSEEHTSELQSLMRISYAVFCLKKKTET